MKIIIVGLSLCCLPAVAGTWQTGQSTKQAEITPQTPLPSATMEYARKQAMPLTPTETKVLHQEKDQLDRSIGQSPISAIPRISSETVKLSPGASLPLLRVLPNYPSTVNFTDETGAPWPIAAPPVYGNQTGFEVNFIPNSSAMIIQALQPYETGSVTVFLKGLTTPIIISLASGEPDNPKKGQITDSRKDLRIPLRGPNGQAQVSSNPKIALYSDTLQAFLDGVPPKGARLVKTTGMVPMTQVWQLGDDLYVRTREPIRDEFEQTLSSADGTHLFKLPVTPLLTFSVDGKSVPLTLTLE